MHNIVKVNNLPSELIPLGNYEISYSGEGYYDENNEFTPHGKCIMKVLSMIEGCIFIIKTICDNYIDGKLNGYVITEEICNNDMRICEGKYINGEQSGLQLETYKNHTRLFEICNNEPIYYEENPSIEKLKEFYEIKNKFYPYRNRISYLINNKLIGLSNNIITRFDYN